MAFADLAVIVGREHLLKELWINNIVGNENKLIFFFWKKKSDVVRITHS